MGRVPSEQKGHKCTNWEDRQSYGGEFKGVDKGDGKSVQNPAERKKQLK